ncbi:MAG: hypothetical protein WBQ76_11705 [Candidatus Korobacteraceae bacterium]
MSSDNVFDQVEALIASDERQALPEPADAILRAMAKVPGAGPVVALVRYESERQRAENSDLMLRTAWAELKRVSFDVENLREDATTRDEVKRLIIDATRKAEDLRDRKRIERIGMILAHAMTLPVKDFDKAEEMMRVARDLSDPDVLGLSYLYDAQFDMLNRNMLRIDVDEVNRCWKAAPPKISGVLEPELDSIFLKLQGLGLATSVERRDSSHEPNARVYALLPKGADFVRYIEGAIKA